MSSFDPDAYLAAKASFDPDSYLASKQAPKEPEGLGTQLARGALDIVPALGGVAGATLGSALGPMGSLGGGAAGYAAAKGLTDIARHYAFGDEAPPSPITQPTQALKRAGGDLVDGATTELGGQALGAAAPLAAKALGNGVEALANSGAAKTLSTVADGALGLGAMLHGPAAFPLIAAKKLIEGHVDLGKVAQLLKAAPEALGPYAQVLQGALARGPAALQATHSVLMRDPTYATLIEGQGDGNSPN